MTKMSQLKIVHNTDLKLNGFYKKCLILEHHSMAIANLNKSEDLVTNTTAASMYIHAEEAQNLHQWKSPLSDLTS